MSESTWDEKGVIAVGLDETPSSRKAMIWAAREAARRGATLQVITAWSWDAMEGAPLAAIDPEAMREAAAMVQKQALEIVTPHLEDHPVIATEIVQTTPAEALIEASKHADLVVVGSHGRGPVRAMLQGSVSQSVVRHAVCPVVVMPPHQGEVDEHEAVPVQASR
jgi:nucleotide-binding universal stress UspA family protein